MLVIAAPMAVATFMTMRRRATGHGLGRVRKNEAGGNKLEGRARPGGSEGDRAGPVSGQVWAGDRAKAAGRVSRLGGARRVGTGGLGAAGAADQVVPAAGDAFGSPGGGFG
jgi:hypothetical protein